MIIDDFVDADEEEKVLIMISLFFVFMGLEKVEEEEWVGGGGVGEWVEEE